MTRIFESSENGGMHPEVPGYSGAIRALLADDGTVLEVVPYGSPFSSEKPVEPVQQEEQPVEEVQPVEPIQEQPVEEINQAG